MSKPTPEQIDALLPQTQCGLCEYDGCLPYAQAIAIQGEAINRCLPGGVPTLLALAEITTIDPSDYIDDMRQKTKAPSVAVIDEAACIGCTKCIQACPVDAIFGASKLMHTVIVSECTGCELCIPPCPVDCIAMVAVPQPSETVKKQQANLARQRHQTRNTRLERDKIEKRAQHQKAKLGQSKDQTQTRHERQAAIKAALARVKKKASAI